MHSIFKQALEPFMPRPQIVAWRCYDKIFEQYSITDSKELADARARRPEDWEVTPLVPAKDGPL